MFGNLRVGQILDEIFEAREYFYQYFAKQGVEFTKGYLSAFTGIRKFLAEQSLSAESNKYHGAKMFLGSVPD